MRFIVFDTETGGLNSSETDILEAFFAIVDENLQVIDTLGLRIKPDGDKPYRVTAGALRVNKINLVEHHSKSAPVSACRDALTAFLARNCPEGKERLIPCGHNVPFDIGFVKQLVSDQVWEQFVGHRLMDTAVTANFLALAGKLDSKSLSLSGLCRQLGIEQKGAHTASGDVVATIMVLRKFTTMMTGAENDLPLIKEAT